MNQQIPKTYYRVDVTCSQQVLSGNEIKIVLPQGLESRLKPRHGLIIASWNESTEMGEVNGLGVVKSVNPVEGIAVVIYAPVQIHLKPNPSGRRYWRNPYLCFAKAVEERYMLQDLFAENFPDYSGIEFEQPISLPRDQDGRSNRYVPVEGYVYVIRSDYGFKIGKTVNIKNRVRLFEVKLPFPIKLESYAWFDNYSEAEADFHRKFADKRTEGEWFDLSPRDLDYICSQGKQISTEGL